MTFVQYFKDLFGNEEINRMLLSSGGGLTVRGGELHALFLHFMRLDQDVREHFEETRALKETIDKLQIENAELHAEADWLRDLSGGVKAIGDERKRQVSVEGWTAAHVDQHDAGDLAGAGATYALSAGCELGLYDGQPLKADELPDHWPFSAAWWKPEDPRRDLVKAGALIAAEIDRYDRQQEAGAV